MERDIGILWMKKAIFVREEEREGEGNREKWRKRDRKWFRKKEWYMCKKMENRERGEEKEGKWAGS